MFAFIQKLIALFSAMLAFFGFARGIDHNNGTAADAKASYSVHGKSVEFTFTSNPSTGYGWQCNASGDSIILKEEHYESGNHGNVAGAAGNQHYTFTAVSPGKTSITFVYERSWETDPPFYTYIAELQADDNLNITVLSFQSV